VGTETELGETRSKGKRAEPLNASRARREKGEQEVDGEEEATEEEEERLNALKEPDERGGDEICFIAMQNR
jgi:hypothetical protein